MDTQINLTPAGYMPTREEYAQARRVAENLAAQLEVRDHTIATRERALAAVTAELDILNERQRLEWSRAETAEAEVARLKAWLTIIVENYEGRIFETDAALALQWAKDALRGQPAPAHDGHVLAAGADRMFDWEEPAPTGRE